jgi:uncharacterized membrane protein YwzB
MDKRLTALAAFALIIAVIATAVVIPNQLAITGYGVPGITVRTFTETEPKAQVAYINSGYGTVTTLDYTSPTVEAKWSNVFGQQRYVHLQLHVTLKVNIQVSDLASPQYMATINTPTYVQSNEETSTTYTNATIKTYAYGFKIEVQWSGSAVANVIDSRIDSAVPPGTPSYDDLLKQAVATAVSNFNVDYITSAKILLSIDAPALAAGAGYALNPDYLGMMGMWLSDYKMAGYTSGTAVQGLPNTIGTSVQLYSDAGLTRACWAASYSGNTPLLTPAEAYWLSSFAPQSAFFQVQIVSLGSQLIYDTSKAGPNYLPDEPYNPGTPKTTGLTENQTMFVFFILAAVAAVAVIIIGYAAYKKKKQT